MAAPPCPLGALRPRVGCCDPRRDGRCRVCRRRTASAAAPFRSHWHGLRWRCHRRCTISVWAVVATSALASAMFGGADAHAAQSETGKRNCADSHESCERWAALDECNVNPNYMHQMCAMSCGTCFNDPGNIHSKQEPSSCARPPGATPAVAPGDVERFFRRIARLAATGTGDQAAADAAATTAGKDSCGAGDGGSGTGAASAAGDGSTGGGDPRIEARGDSTCAASAPPAPRLPLPHEEGEGPPFLLQEEFLALSPSVLLRPPRGAWILQFDTFLSRGDCAALLLGFGGGFKRSTGVGRIGDDGMLDRKESTGRTSSNLWCMGDCATRPAVVELNSRISNLTGVPVANTEYFQVLRYTTDQSYWAHNDFIPEQVRMPCGPRVFTFFLYLSDVEQGGETSFRDYQGQRVQVTPRAGRALLWANVRSDNPLQIEHGVEHVARNVRNGTKYAMNAWLHLYDFRGPHALRCTG